MIVAVRKFRWPTALLMLILVIRTCWCQCNSSDEPNTTTFGPPTTTEPHGYDLACYKCTSTQYNGCGGCFVSTGLGQQSCYGRCTTKTTFDFVGVKLLLNKVERACSTDKNAWLNGCRNEGAQYVCYKNCTSPLCNNEQVTWPSTAGLAHSLTAVDLPNGVDAKLTNDATLSVNAVSSSSSSTSLINCYSCDSSLNDGCGRCFRSSAMAIQSCYGLCITSAYYETYNEAVGSKFVLTTVRRSCATELSVSGEGCQTQGSLVVCTKTCDWSTCDSGVPSPNKTGSGPPTSDAAVILLMAVIAALVAGMSGARG